MQHVVDDPAVFFLQFQELCAKWLHEIFFVNQSEEYLKHNSQALNGLQVNDFFLIYFLV